MYIFIYIEKEIPVDVFYKYVCIYTLRHMEADAVDYITAIWSGVGGTTRKQKRNWNPKGGQGQVWSSIFEHLKQKHISIALL